MTASELRKNVRAVVDEVQRGKGASAAKGRDDEGREQLVGKTLQELGYDRPYRTEKMTFRPLSKEERMDRINPGWRWGRPTPIDQPQIRGLVGLALDHFKQRR